MMRLSAALVSLLIVTPLAARQQALSQTTYQRLQQSQQLIESGDSLSAISQLKKMLASSAGQPYEQAVVLQTMAQAYIASQHYAAAIPWLERSVSLAALPDAAQQRLRHDLAQLYLATGRFKAAIALLRQWLAKSDKPSPEIHAMLGSAHLQLKHYRKAIAPLRQAIALSRTPKESWYQGLLSAQNALRHYDQCAALLRDMIVLFPQRPRYWQQLAGIEMTRERHGEALAVLELAWRRGYLSRERDLLQLAQLYLYRTEPYKAADLMVQEIAQGRISATATHWQLTADAWYQARETTRSITALTKALAIESRPALVLRLAELQLLAGQWQAVESTLQQVINKGGYDADTRGKAWLLLGRARYEDRATKNARAAFTQARAAAATRADAEQWLAFLATQD